MLHKFSWYITKHDPPNGMFKTHIRYLKQVPFLCKKIRDMLV